MKYTNPGTLIKADAFEVFAKAEPADFVFLDPPYEDIPLIRKIITEYVHQRWRLMKSNARNAMVCFMWLRDVPRVFQKFFTYPDNIVVWEKPYSTKNTSKDYSSFLEAICVWHGKYFNKDLHWANRTGIFVDRLIEKPVFEHKKPDTLVERLIKLHTPDGGTVLDLFAGTGTVKSVCDRCGFSSLSCDIAPKCAL